MRVDILESLQGDASTGEPGTLALATLCVRIITLLYVFCFFPVGWVRDAECVLIPACDVPTRGYIVTHYTRGARDQPPAW